MPEPIPAHFQRHSTRMKYISLVALLFVASPLHLHAQCSDAGVCSIGSPDSMSGHGLRAGYTLGRSGKADDLTIHTVQLEGIVRFSPEARLSVVVPWSRTSGPPGSAQGIGDVTILWNQTVWSRPEHLLSVQAGGKLATGTVNDGNLPQAYQPGLGTNDLLLGLAYETGPWLFAAGYQLSRGRSDNAVTRLKRGDDILGRAGYRTRVADLPATVELLALQRLQQSSILDPSDPGGNRFMTVAGSDRLQVNVLATLSLPISDRTGLRTAVAVPLRSRAVNVDGLTRSFTASFDVLYTF